MYAEAPQQKKNPQHTTNHTTGKVATNLLLRKEVADKEDALQMRLNPLQKQSAGEEERVQMKEHSAQLQPGFDEEEDAVQMKEEPVHRVEDDEDESLQMKQNPLQRRAKGQNPLRPIKYDNPFQRKAAPAEQEQSALQPKKENNTGLPNNLKAGVEALSGYSMDDVKVHYNSDKPAQLQALAYAQGTNIHIAPGQEQHLPHEAWHVVQQKQGRVQPTVQMKQDVAVNDDKGLENEADMMGEEAIKQVNKNPNKTTTNTNPLNNIIQRKVVVRIRSTTQSADLPRVVASIEIKGRASTNVKGSVQGDHTVAQTLINESVIREVMNMPRKVALNNMFVLASKTLSDEDSKELQSKYGKYWEAFDKLEGEDQNNILEETIQNYIEMANKRPGTAYLRKEGLTTGGGKEKQGINDVRGFANKLEKGEQINSHDLFNLADSVIALVDIKYISDQENLYFDTIKRALQHVVLSVLLTLTEEDSNELIETIVTGLGQKHNIPNERIIPLYEEIIKFIESNK